jgi:hypothetical protein
VLRRLLASAAAFGLLAAPALAATHTTDVPDRFGKRIDRVRTRSGIRVLLPSRLQSEFKTLYPDASSRKGHYELDLGAAKHCRAATACFVASFLGDKGSTFTTGSKVALARGRTGFFSPTTCGASCAAPQMQWVEKGVLYTVQAKGFAEDAEKASLKKLANSAIRHGDRG